MATTPTQLPVPSEKPQDLKFNAGKIDEFVTSMGWTYTDRFGNKHYTIEGINYLAQQAMAAFGYTVLAGLSFDTGATITDQNQILFNDVDNSYYKWTGSLIDGPKVVPENSTPETSGGVGPGKWLNVGDTGLRNEVFALNGGVARSFQTVADMKAFDVVNGHSYSTAGYYTAGDGGGAIYLATTTGATPDGYGDHVASNGVFLRLKSIPTDLNYGVKVVATYDPPTAWHNRNALQTMLRDTRWGYVEFCTVGSYYALGGINVGRNDLTVNHKNGCKIVGRYSDPSIPDSITTQAGGMFVFSWYTDPDHGDFTINTRVSNINYILNGEIETEYNVIHENPYNNNCISMNEATNCTVKGNGGVTASDHRGVNFDGGAINCHIDIGFCNNVVDNALMIYADNDIKNSCSIKVGRVTNMLPGGYGNPSVINASGGGCFDVDIGSFAWNGSVKPILVWANGCESINVKAGYVNGASQLLRQYETLDSDVTASNVFNTVSGIVRAGTKLNRMRSACLHGIKITDSVFLYPYRAETNADAFSLLEIGKNNFSNAGSTFQFYNGRATIGLPIRLDIYDNQTPSGITVVDFNRYTAGITGNLATIGAASASLNYKSPDWLYGKLSVCVQFGGVNGACEIDLRSRVITSGAVTFTAGDYKIVTTISGNTITLTPSGGAVMVYAILHN